MQATDPAPPESIEALIASERLHEAAARCMAEGDGLRALELLERAAAFEEAALLAAELGSPARAVRLASMTGSDLLIEAAARGLDRDSGESLGADLLTRGQHRAAALVFSAVGAHLAAADAWRRAEEPLRAASASLAGGDAISAARALTARLEHEPGDLEAGLLLGRVLVENARHAQAASTLQAVLRSSEVNDAQAREARALLAVAFEQLGLREARASLGEVEDLRVDARATTAVLFGRYEVEAVVATTQTARVVRCLDRLTGKRVALKMLRPGAGGLEGRDAVGRLAREARALAMLHHPHVLPLLGFINEGPAVILPWMSGGSLADLRVASPLSPARAVEVALAVLGALDEAHRIGILHRDVKPSNVLFDDAGAPYLADFGAAHVSDASATVTAGLIGSLSYMSPEQLAARPATVASDLYAVGALLYEAITGGSPAPADALSRLPSEAHPELGEAHDRALCALLAREPADRPESAATASALLHALRWSDEPAPVTSASPSSQRAAPSSIRRLVPLDDGAAWDSLLGRRVRVLPADEPHLALARAFARAGVPALVTIFKVDQGAGIIWTEDPPGTPLAMLSRRLSPDERTALAAALDALHREGLAHGSVDVEHVRLDPARGVVLALPDERRPQASFAEDLALLATL